MDIPDQYTRFRNPVATAVRFTHTPLLSTSLSLKQKGFSSLHWDICLCCQYMTTLRKFTFFLLPFTEKLVVLFENKIRLVYKVLNQ